MNWDRFARRIKLLQDLQCHVLRLQGAIQHLWRGTLPPRSVVLTFDDGYYNFELVFRLLQQYGFPATVYYLPVFNLVCPYLFWKSSLEQIKLDGLAGLARPLNLDLRTAAARERAASVVKAFSAKLSVPERDQNARRLAKLLKVDYRQSFDQRLFHSMSREQVKVMADHGIDFQLHTHEHCLPATDEGFAEAIGRNRSRIQSIVGREPTHLAYPNGEIDLTHFSTA